MNSKLYHYCALSDKGYYKSGAIMWRGPINVNTFYIDICNSISEDFTNKFVVLSLTCIGETNEDNPS